MKIDTSKFEAKKQKLLERIGYIVENEAKIRAPVVTGNLRARISHVVEGNSVKIGTEGVPYASFVEYGTRVMVSAHGEHDPENPVTSWKALEERGGAGQTLPFLRAAAFMKEEDIRKAFKEELGR